MIRLIFISVFSLGMFFSINSHAGCDCEHASSQSDWCDCMTNSEFGPKHEKGGDCYERAILNPRCRILTP